MFPFLDDISGTIRGYRVFTACRTTNGKVFRLEDHLQRLYRSAEAIHMQPPMPPDDLRKLLNGIVHKNLEEYPATELHIEVIFSGGLLDNTMRKSNKGAHLYVAVQALVKPGRDEYENGVALATFPHQRMLPDVKLLNYVGAVVAFQTVVPDRDAYDVLFVDPHDRRTILEGSTFTIFFVDTDGGVLTPPMDGRILDSITRRAIIEQLQPDTGFKVRETPITLDRVAEMSEAFLASTTRNVLAVTRIDDTILGDGRPGPVTGGVAKLFQSYFESY